MKSATVQRHARLLRRICRDAAQADRLGVTRIYGDRVVGDLPEFTMLRIAAWSQAWKLEDAFRQWLMEQGRVA